MQNELKQISLRWISIFSDSESKYVKYNKQSDFLSSHFCDIFALRDMSRCLAIL